ncbi:MAG: thymidine phosphorylase [bacterium]
MIPDIIAKKREGLELTYEEIAAVVLGYLDGLVTEAQTAAWLMAVVLRGMSSREIADLTECMRLSGDQLDLSSVPGPHIDKHSTGGVGDKTSLVIVPLLAAAGATVIKMSGRGLSFTGGTADKLEAIPGFQTEMDIEQMLEQAERIGACMATQSKRLVPADKALYALRDVTATVPSIPLIASSIMSKKLAAGSETIILDVKTGIGSFMPTLDEARKLAKTLIRIGRGSGRAMGALITDMNQPLGSTVGIALEVAEAIETLTPGGKKDERFYSLCLTLCAHSLRQAKQVQSVEEGEALARNIIESGAALEKFREIIIAQHGDPKVIENPSLLPKAPIKHTVMAEKEGYIAKLNARTIGQASLTLGAGRTFLDAPVAQEVGLEIHKQIGDKVKPGDPLITIHARNNSDVKPVITAIQSAYEFSPSPTTPPPLIYEVFAD